MLSFVAKKKKKKQVPRADQLPRAGGVHPPGDVLHQEGLRT
jgi:hypothetical protein